MKSRFTEIRSLWLPGFAFFFTIGLSTLNTTAQAEEPKTTPTFQRILFLGNSITLHGPSKKIGWDGNWGMAASRQDNDYVHLVTRSLAKSTGDTPKMLAKNIATFERQYATFDLKNKLKDAFAFQPDLVILAIGENVPSLKTAEEQAQFQASVGKLLKQLQTDNQPTIIVRSSFWANQMKDEALRKACQKAGGTYVDISSLSKDEKHYARSERDFQHAGVAAHPGDQGMQAIADAILKAVQP
ncbi:SGNH/GDSL hydrolase family protein [Gimesia sp.]|uniref:SGNH/GDSL hydrolase family protein n=1 Tax=Gimesia sp. TaxID=2024833 RepID=UPI003A8EC090